jgi:hypothetical protein
MKYTIPIVIFFVVSSCAQKETDAPAGVAPSIDYKASPAKSPSSVPYLFTDKHGAVLMSWIEQGDGLNVFKWSKLQGEQWSQPKVIASGNSWFVNWADYPMIATDGKTNLISHVLEKRGEGTYSYDIKMFTSADGGNNWNKPFVLHDDGKEAEHGFVSLVPYGDNVFVCWLDGRNTASEGVDHSKVDDGGHHGSMSLRAAVIDYSGNKINEWELDSKTCDCCQTTSVITDNGPVVVYRDRSDEEIRDLSIVRFIDDKWTEPQAVFHDNWKISGCPVNGPRADAKGNHVSVAWFSAAGGKPMVNVIFSDDGGATFGSPVRVDEGKPNGRVDVAQLDKNSSMVSWMEEGNIKAVKVYSDGTKEPPVMIAGSSESRSSGFPQMTLQEERIIFAWTDDNEKIVKMATLSLQ